MAAGARAQPRVKTQPVPHPMRRRHLPGLSLAQPSDPLQIDPAVIVGEACAD